jgi:DNA-binding MarR family transcriptional regulator
VTADAAHVWAGLRALVHERYDRRKEVADALGMSFIRIKALRHLASDGPVTMRRLAAVLQTDAPYTTVVVEDLVRRGYVERTVDTADRRVKIVQITPDGAALAARADALLAEPPKPLRDLPPDDLAALDRIVAKLLDASGDLRRARWLWPRSMPPGTGLLNAALCPARVESSDAQPELDLGPAEGG